LRKIPPKLHTKGSGESGMIFRWSSSWVVALVGVCSLAYGAEPLETFRVNLNPLIDKAVRHSTQFAVDVARRIDSESNGRWQVDQTNATWDYSIRIPTAVSMGFHASRLMLPADGTLTVTAGDQSFVYRGRDLRRSEFWSRPVRGDQVSIHISVPKQMRHQAFIDIAAFQAGYKSLSTQVADNPHYAAIKPRAPQGSGSCVENYACDATPATQNAANASVAIVIANQFECSGTLLNDVPQDGVPYVLTARHCENGEDAGGDPGAAASVEIFWNAVTTCGQTLTSIFDATAQVQFGATTVVEQQDEWLIRLDAAPPVTNVYYAGWDATDTELVDGYSIEYAGAYTQQYVTWAGSAITEDLSAQTLGVGYASTYWGVVNSLGSVDHGASGSGLFNTNNQVVGSASRAATAGACPVSPPPAPSTNSVVALYNKLAGTWSSTSDASSSTGTTTLASVLDPANSGTTAMSGVLGAPAYANIFTSQSSSQIGNTVLLQFESNPGAVCTANGGLPGDLWGGPVNAYPSGIFGVSENQPGSVTYGITCTSGSRSKSAQVTVTWSLAQPTLTFVDQAFPNGLFAGAANPLAWISNQPSCTATGGTAGDGWSGTLPGSGNVIVTESQPGTYSYTVTCGTGTQAISQSLTLTFAAPSASLVIQSPTGLRVGQTIGLVWSGNGGCTATGGGAGDGWAGPVAPQGILDLAEQTAGTYTYTISCGPAQIAAVAQSTYTFSNAAPSATLTAAQPTQLIDLTVPTYPTLLTWSSNVQPCNIDYSGPVTGNLFTGFPSQGTDTQPQIVAGLYTYTLSCGFGSALATSTATINWMQQPVPQVTLTTVGNEFVVQSGGYLHWTTNVLPCIGSGGTSGDHWNGPLPYYTGAGDSSNALIVESTPGTYIYTITCGVGNVATAQATAIYNSAGGSQLMLSPGTSQVVTGQPTNITWNSTVGSCTGYDGSSGDGWNGPQPAQGSINVIETVPNDYTLSLVCGVGSQAVEAQTKLYVFQATAVSVQLTPNNYSSAVGHPVTLGWTGYQAASCTATGGNAGDGWTGTLPYSGSMMVSETQTGPVTYGLTCQNGSLSAQTTATVQWAPAPNVTLSSSTQQGVWGTPFTLTWTSSNAANCSASEDGSLNGTWTGPLSDAGSATVQESAGASHTYGISCMSSYGNVQAQVTVNFSAPPTPPAPPASGGSSGTSSSSHGGGDLDLTMLGILAALASIRYWRSGRKPQNLGGLSTRPR
jgi:lysyl endopeptidase